LASLPAHSLHGASRPEAIRRGSKLSESRRTHEINHSRLRRSGNVGCLGWCGQGVTFMRCPADLGGARQLSLPRLGRARRSSDPTKRHRQIRRRPVRLGDRIRPLSEVLRPFPACRDRQKVTQLGREQLQQWSAITEACGRLSRCRSLVTISPQVAPLVVWASGSRWSCNRFG